MDAKGRMVSALSALAQKQWDLRKRPLLLSDVPRLLAVDYPDINREQVLGDMSLKKFVKETAESSSYKVIEHPNQKPKVGILPPSASYKFPADVQEHHVSLERSGERERMVLDFIKLLGDLPAGELEKVVIPASVLVKLLK
ncbi:hypothetical protein [Luteibacter sahnii]|uniref:hypothetical protein n=1 Tax=Luteibacter sahnii TaxID=3021977 RepID=UPI002A69F710|nr:hypothetical protein [Luteibacter sp. PPL193]MDY1548549.1 hypothetical protein [Luteibacter sp. PPL193]